MGKSAGCSLRAYGPTDLRSSEVYPDVHTEMMQ